MQRILIALSGGVDSAVAAYLLSKQRCELIAVTMMLLPCARLESELRQNCCCSKKSIDAAQRISAHFGIPHYVVDLSYEFEKRIIGRFLNEYSNGRTPNPCIWCNREIKFGALLEKARTFGCDTVATGHYAKIERDTQTNKLFLRKGKDSIKDQSYFLYALTQRQLSNAIFPLAELTKAEVRKIAKEIGIAAYNTQESQDICFIPGNDYTYFLHERLGGSLRPGNFKDKSGNILGKHKGIQLYTVGQRRRLGIAKGKPLYVTKIDATSGDITLGPKEEVYSDYLIAEELNWIAFDKPPEEFRCRARIRYSHKEAQASVQCTSESSVAVKFEEPQLAITPGQSVVFYDGDRVLGGGIIR